jgi:hypothetical protein
MKPESEATTFLRSRMCYYHTKFKQQGRFSAIWQQKRHSAMDRLRTEQGIYR